MEPHDALAALAEELERDQATLQRELDEIELLLKQVTSEAERHEARRVEAEARLAAAERHSGASEDLTEARTQLLTQTRRATLMQSQLDVLAGKQRVLQRYRERLAATLPIVREASARVPAAGTPGARTSSPAEVLAAQETMRREIARQMHDGPAQSIANIALQAQIVQRLFEQDPARAAQELSDLVQMVQHALEATKSFIFDVRPMVLDDLGLVPTLRRSAREWGRRSGIDVQFESVGADRRLATELESGVFRMIDDAVEGLMRARPTDLVVRLDWSEMGLRATVGGRGAAAQESAEARARAVVAAARRDRALPQQLATMIREQEDETARSIGLPDDVRAELEQHAAALGIGVSISDDRWNIEFTVR